jgi:non-specific serine/threonine protein kinase
MSGDHWEQVQLLFDELIELDAGHRRARLELLSRTDPGLCDELRSLIDAHERAGDFLNLVGAPPTDTTPTSEPVAPVSGTYTLLREIGHGGMGRVYLAHDARLDRHVALKLLPGDRRSDPGRNARFLAEARSAAALDHPNVATIYEIGETRDGGLFIAMAYYGQETLRERIARGPLPLVEALGIAQQIAEGLGAAHERGIVHRDIKPENILITANGVAKIVDFGIAKIAGHDWTRTGDALGTPHYMAPEQVRGDAVDARADLWALGVVLHEMLASERPWSGESVAAILHAVLDKPSAPLPDNVPAGVRRLIDRLLARNLGKRYASAADVRDALRRIIQGESEAPAGADAAAETAPEGDATALPASLTSFIGREREVTRIDALLEHERLLTLTGPGGMGKTRLALHAAAAQTRRFRDGVHFVSLVPITDPALVPQSVAQTLGLRDAGGVTHREQLMGHLRERRALLVLDNFEHVLEAAPFVAELLATCRGVAVLATSRAPLGIRGEHELPVPPLFVPAPEELSTPDRLAEPGDAVRLFVQRARGVHPDFALTTDNASTVARICGRLDGMPLAIELAAARTRLLPPRALLARLDQRLDVLRSDARDLPERHRTLREVIGWSHGLLGASEQIFFRRLAVFAGGFTVGAAEALTASLGDGRDVLEPLTALVSHSLLRQDEQPDGEPRFAMLETIHAFARERLGEAGEEDAARRAHFEIMLATAEEAVPHLRGPDQRTWFERLEREHDNLRGALDYALDRGHVDEAIRMAEALVRFWTAGFHTEGRDRLGRVLAVVGPARNPQARARLLLSHGVMTHMQGAPVEAARRFEEAERLFREAEDEHSVAVTRNHLSWSMYLTGEPARAIALAEEALAVHERFGDVRGMALAHNNLGWVRFYHRGELAQAREHLEQAFRGHQSLDDPRGVTFMSTSLAALEMWMGNVERARAILKDGTDAAYRTGDAIHRAAMSLWSVVISYETLGSDDVVASLDAWLPTLRALGFLWATGLALRTAGDVRRDAGDAAGAEPLYAESVALYRRGDTASLVQVLTRQADARRQRGMSTAAREALDEAFAITRRLGSRFLLPECLDVLARVRRDEGDARGAARLFGAAERQRTAIGAVLPPRRRAPHAREIDSLREALGAESFFEAWGEDEPTATLR